MTTLAVGDEALTIGMEVRAFSFETITKNGFWFHIKARPSFNPQAY